MSSVGITTEYEKEAEQFYKKVLKELTALKLPFVIGGTYAVKFYTDITRPTKDIDIFCRTGDYMQILKSMRDAGFKIQIKDERWLARIVTEKYFVDLIFGSIPGLWSIDNDWIEKAPTGEVFKYKVKFTPPEELIISKAFRLRRREFDGADINHIILKQGKKIDWKHLLNRMDSVWELLFFHLTLFRFTYPSERDIVPKWLIQDLIKRVELQLELPLPEDKVSRGALLSPNQYTVGWKKWGFKNITEFTTVI